MADRTGLARRLPPETYRELTAICEAIGIRIEAWARVSWLRVYIEVRAVAEVSQAEGCGRDRAADLVGVDPGTVDQRFTRARRHAFDPDRGGMCRTDRLSVPPSAGGGDHPEDTEALVTLRRLP